MKVVNTLRLYGLVIFVVTLAASFLFWGVSISSRVSQIENEQEDSLKILGNQVQILDLDLREHMRKCR